MPPLASTPRHYSTVLKLLEEFSLRAGPNLMYVGMWHTTCQKERVYNPALTGGNKDGQQIRDFSLRNGNFCCHLCTCLG